jgi:hypothetical protein
VSRVRGAVHAQLQHGQASEGGQVSSGGVLALCFCGCVSQWKYTRYCWGEQLIVLFCFVLFCLVMFCFVLLRSAFAFLLLSCAISKICCLVQAFVDDLQVIVG